MEGLKDFMLRVLWTALPNMGVCRKTQYSCNETDYYFFHCFIIIGFPPANIRQVSDISKNSADFFISLKNQDLLHVG